MCTILGNRDIKKIINTVYECFSIEKGTSTSREAGNYEIPEIGGQDLKHSFMSC